MTDDFVQLKDAEHPDGVEPLVTNPEPDAEPEPAEEPKAEAKKPARKAPAKKA